MRSYTLTDLRRRIADVVEAISLGPVQITCRGKRSWIIMTAERYDRLCQPPIRPDDPRRVYAAGETPPEIAALFAADLDRMSRGEGYDD